jgi:sec-independent protein translocase protein TatA
MGSFGGIEILVIVLVVLLLFGAKKIPELARGLGQGITEFRKASSDIRKELEKSSEEPAEPRREEKKREEQKVSKEKEEEQG